MHFFLLFIPTVNIKLMNAILKNKYPCKNYVFKLDTLEICFGILTVNKLLQKLIIP